MDGLTKDERRTAATLWAVSAAPFYIGNDMTKLDQYGVDLLTNPEVIGVNQAGRPAQPRSSPKTNKQVWYSLNADSLLHRCLVQPRRHRGQHDGELRGPRAGRFGDRARPVGL